MAKTKSLGILGTDGTYSSLSSITNNSSSVKPKKGTQYYDNGSVYTKTLLGKKKKKKDEEDVRTVKTEDTVKQNTQVSNTPNKEGYIKTNQKYGYYDYHDYKNKKDFDIYKKDGKAYYYDPRNKTYNDMDTPYYADPTQDKKELKEAKKYGYKERKTYKTTKNGKRVEVLPNTVAERVELETSGLTKKEKKKYAKSLIKQKDKEVKKSSYVREGSTLGELKYMAKSLKENTEPLGRIDEAYDYGKLQQEMSLAYSDMLKGKKVDISKIQKKIDNYNKFNKDVAEANTMLDTYVKSVPGQLRGMKKGVENAGALGTIGAIGGGTIGAVATKTPQGAVAGAETGAKWLGGAGYVKGQAQNTYELESGATYQTLLEMGVPDKIARKEAKRVGTENALIESGESILDLLTFGKAGAATNALKEGLIKKYGAEALKKWGVSYATNIVSEGLEEGTQEQRSIAAEKRAAEKAGIERDDSQDVQRILESAKAGGFGAAITGAGTRIAGMGGSSVYNMTKQKASQMLEIQQQVNNGTMTHEEANQKIEQVNNGTYDKNKVLDEIATQKRDEVEQAAQQGIISPAQATQEIQALNNTLVEEREQISRDSKIEAMQETIQQMDVNGNISKNYTNEQLQEFMDKVYDDNLSTEELQDKLYDTIQYDYVRKKSLEMLNDFAKDTNMTRDEFIKRQYSSGDKELNITKEDIGKIYDKYHKEETEQNKKYDFKTKVTSKDVQFGDHKDPRIIVGRQASTAYNKTLDQYKMQVEYLTKDAKQAIEDYGGIEKLWKDAQTMSQVEIANNFAKNATETKQSVNKEQVQKNTSENKEQEIKQVENKSDLKEVIDEDLYNVDIKDVENQIYRENYKLNEDVEDEEGPTGNYWDIDDTYFELKDGNTLWIQTPVEYGKFKNGKTNYSKEIHNKIKMFIEDAEGKVVDEYNLTNEKGEFSREDILNGIKQLTYDDSNKQAEGQIDMFGNVHVGKLSDNAETAKQETNQTTQSKQEKPIQGLGNYTRQEIKDITKDYIQNKLSEAGIDDVNIEGIEINGSRARGTANQDSDLDVVVEYSGNVREDSMFNMLNEEKLNIDGIDIDINPITKEKTGNLKSYMEKSNQYDKEIIEKRNENIPAKSSDNVISEKIEKPKKETKVQEKPKKEEQQVPNKITAKDLRQTSKNIAKELNEAFKLNKNEAYSKTPQTAVKEMSAYQNPPTISDFDRETVVHTILSDEEAKINAEKTYNENGTLEENAAYIRGLLQSDKRLTKNDKALAVYTMKEAYNQGKKEIGDGIIQDLTVLDIEAGQWIQASKLMKQMSPVGQLETFVKMVKHSIDKGNPRFKNVKITDEMINEVIEKSYNDDNTWNQDKFAANMEKFKADIQDQLTPTLMDKFNTIRMIGMLGAPKTHIRNMLANVGNLGLRVSKNFNARLLETAFVRDQNKRTRTFKPTTKEIKNFAERTMQEEKETIAGNKYDESRMDLERNMKAFNENHKGLARVMNPISKLTNLYSGGNTYLLNAEDTLFSAPTYKRSLQEFLTARGMKTEEQVLNNPKILRQAKDFALQQALESVYRQNSELANSISSFVRKMERSDKKRHKLAGVLVEGELPFKRTPINIGKTGWEYSPVGLTSGIYDTFKSIKSDKVEISQAIDEISKGITGLGLLGVGVLLAHNGWELTAGEDDKDKKSKYDKALGEKEYSIKIGNRYYDVSWMAPSAMPFYTGIELYQQLVKTQKFNGDAIVGTVAKTIDPLSSMSFMYGITRTLQSYAKNAGEAVSTLILADLENYVSQYIPTLLSQIANISDSKRRTTTVSGDSNFKEFDKTWNNIKYKVPGLRQTLPEATDAWGRTAKNDEFGLRFFNSLVNPANNSKDIKDSTDKEIERLYYALGEDDRLATGSIPKQEFDKYLTYDKKQYNLSSEDWTKFKKTYGKIAKKGADKLVKTEKYKKASDEEKAKYLISLYDYANQKAKQEYGIKEGLNYESYKLDQIYALADAFNMPIETVITNKSIQQLRAKNGVSGNKRKYAAVDNIDGLTEIQKDVLKRKFTMFMGHPSYKKTKSGKNVSYEIVDALYNSNTTFDDDKYIKKFLDLN